MKKRYAILVFMIVLVVLSLACSLAGGNEGGASSTADNNQAGNTQVEVDPGIELGDAQQVDEGGFSFRPLPGYDLQPFGGLVTMLEPGANPDLGPVFTLIGGIVPEMTNEQLYAELGNGTEYVIGEAQPVTVAGVSGLKAEVSGTTGSGEIAGYAILVMVNSTQEFIMLVGAPVERWAEIEPLANAVLGSVTFFDPVSPDTSSDSDSGQVSEGSTESGEDPSTSSSVTGEGVPALGYPSGWYIYSNANVVRDLIVYDGTAYAATLGGAVAWDLATQTPTKYTTMDGLGNISTYAITVCDIPETRIVVGTRTGLSFFDPAGDMWDTTPITPDESQLNNSKIDRLYCDAANQRLLISSNGLGILDLNTGEWKKFTTNEGISWNGITDIAVSGTDIWIASGYNGISKISGDEVTVFNEAQGMPSEKANAIASAKDGTLWVGTMQGLVKYAGGKWTLYNRDNAEGMITDINEVEIAPDGTVWITSSPLGGGDICQFDPISAKCLISQGGADGQPILALTLDSEGSPIYGTSKGMHYFNGTDNISMLVENEQLASNFVDSFGMDSSMKLWVGTDAGIQVMDPSAPEAEWITYRRQNTDENTPGGNWASDIAMTDDGSMWFAIINGAASKLQDGVWTVFDDIYSFEVVAVDDQQRVWFGDNSKGIIILSQDGDQVMTLGAADGLPGDDIRVLLADGDTMWIGTSNGLAKYQNDAVTVVFAKDDPILPSAFIVALAVDPSGALLVGASAGLARYDGNQTEVLFEISKMNIGGGMITEVVVDPSGGIWVGTSNGLMFSSDMYSWSRFTTLDGLPTNMITALFADPYGGIWAGGGSNFDGGGILRYVP